MTDPLVSSSKPLFRICSGRWGSALPLLLQDESLLMKDGGGGGSKHNVLTWGGYFCVVLSFFSPVEEIYLFSEVLYPLLDGGSSRGCRAAICGRSH